MPEFSQAHVIQDMIAGKPVSTAIHLEERVPEVPKVEAKVAAPAPDPGPKKEPAGESPEPELKTPVFGPRKIQRR